MTFSTTNGVQKQMVFHRDTTRKMQENRITLHEMQTLRTPDRDLRNILVLKTYQNSNLKQISGGKLRTMETSTRTRTKPKHIAMAMYGPFYDAFYKLM